MPNILHWDIENSMYIGGFFGLYDQTIPHSSIVLDRFVISAQWKWEGGEVQSIRSNGRNDERVIKKLHRLLDKADYAVAHNGDRHDWPIILERFMHYDLPSIKEPVFVDTLKLAKKAHFPSRSLDYLTKKFQLPLKREVEKGLWLAASYLGCKESIKKIEDYGRGDIPALEALYHKLSKHVKTKINRALYTDGPACPHCAGKHVIKSKSRPAGKYLKVQYHCQECGKYHTTGASERKAFLS